MARLDFPCGAHLRVEHAAGGLGGQAHRHEIARVAHELLALRAIDIDERCHVGDDASGGLEISVRGLEQASGGDREIEEKEGK